MNPPRLITDVEDIPSAFLRRIFTYWKAKAGARPGPRRTEISPAELRLALPVIWMWDVIDGGADYGFRLGGERIKTFMNVDLRNKRLSELPKTEFSNEVRHVFSQCVQTCAPLIVGPARMTYEPRNHHTVATLVLPLFENGTDVSTLLGATEIDPAGTSQGRPASSRAI